MNHEDLRNIIEGKTIKVTHCHGEYCMTNVVVQDRYPLPEEEGASYVFTSAEGETLFAHERFKYISSDRAIVIMDWDFGFISLVTLEG